MQDKTTIGISDTFREYITELVKEVVINGEPFDAQKKWLRKNSEAEGLNYETLESNLSDLFDSIKELGEHESKSTERFARNLAKSCYFSETEVDKLIDHAVAIRVQKEAERKAQEEKERKAREEVERKEKEEAERKAREERERKTMEEAECRAREEAERKAKEKRERKTREERERIAKEEDERIVKEAAERKARQEREQKAKEETERKVREEAERQEAERRAKEEAEQKRRLLVEKNKEPVKIMTAVLVVFSLLEIVVLKWWCIFPLVVNAVLGVLTQQNCKDGDFDYEKLVLWGGILVLACFFEAFLGWWSLLLIPITIVLLFFVHLWIYDN